MTPLRINFMKPTEVYVIVDGIRDLREAGENYHAVENPFQNRNRSTSINGAVIRKVVIEDKDIKGKRHDKRYGDNIFKYILKILFVIINDVNYILTIQLF